MNFSLSQEQQDVKGLAAEILADLAAPQNLPDMEVATEWFDARIWEALAEAGLLGVAIPENYGGMGMGFVELCVLLEQIGAAVAPVPALPTLVMGATAIARFGSEEQRAAYLPGVCAGRTVLTAALAELDSRDPLLPSTKALADGDGWRLHGTKICVQAARRAARVLVPAVGESGEVSVFIVDPGAAGVELEDQVSTAGEQQQRMSLDGARVARADRLGDGGGEVLGSIVDHSIAGLCALELGVVDRALRMTAAYTTERHQFGKPIATFQAVAQRAADAYIDVEAIRLATWQAVWRLAQGLPASREVSIAKFFASEAGHRVAYAAQHLHGGIGMDKDYPLHRYYVWSKQIELTLGGARAHLAKLGSALAAA